MTHVWTPQSYGTPSPRVRRNPDAWEEVPATVDDGQEYVIMPNGNLAGPAEDALAELQAAGPRGAAVLGAVAGLVFSGWKAAVIGGFLGYYTGKYFANFASKALVVATSVNKVETVVAKATS